MACASLKLLLLVFAFLLLGVASTQGRSAINIFNVLESSVETLQHFSSVPGAVNCNTSCIFPRNGVKELTENLYQLSQDNLCGEFLSYFFTWNFTELYEDEPTLEQYSPLLGENFIDYPILEEYGVPTVEEFSEEDPDEDDEDDENDENDSTETDHQDKKDNIKHPGKRRDK